jgi:hypothetical protein
LFASDPAIASESGTDDAANADCADAATDADCADDTADADSADDADDSLELHEPWRGLLKACVNKVCRFARMFAFSPFTDHITCLTLKYFVYRSAINLWNWDI